MAKINVFSIVILLLFIGVFARFLHNNVIHSYVYYIYVVMSVLTFVFYGIDKYNAKHHKQRIAERTLHIFALLGGWPGAILAQETLRHKSKKRAFRIVFWLLVMLNCSVLYWFVMNRASYIL